MRKWRRVLLVLLSLVLYLAGVAWGQSPAPVSPGPSSGAVPQNAEASSLIQQANGVLASNPGKALELYQQALKIQPESEEALFNGASAAFATGSLTLAVDFVKRFLKVHPDEPRAITKLIVYAAAAGDSATSEDAIATLRALWKSGKNAELSKQPFFLREMIPLGDDRVFVFETYEPDMSRLVHIWDFVVIGPDLQRKKLFYVEFDPLTTQFMQSQGNKNAQAYFFDVDLPDGHASFRQMDHRPTYAEARATMLPIMRGEVSPASASSHGQITVPATKP